MLLLLLQLFLLLLILLLLLLTLLLCHYADCFLSLFTLYVYGVLVIVPDPL